MLTTVGCKTLVVGLTFVVAPPGSIALLILPSRALGSTFPDRLRTMFCQLQGDLWVWEVENDLRWYGTD